MKQRGHYGREANVTENPHDVIGAAETDIIFECPHCGKSMAIDERGVGLVVTCPDCKRGVQVPEKSGLPGLPAQAIVNDEPPVPQTPLEAAQAKIERLVASLEEVRARRRYLEHLRTEHLARFEQIGREMGIIQNATDRIMALLQDAADEKEPGESAPA